ncbi:6739_t:CDS:1 [Paraglomus occultum]|uniref:6739_t:CDS:1 n=1 Tax=Paraglomus occultum TaxID=144539 RepID=A0A9N8W652_9GLOM|nr:6739_t:CDS:1 [Paraglomus occultum]
MATPINQQPTLNQAYSSTELFTTCSAMRFIDNLTLTEQELFRNPPCTLTMPIDNILNHRSKKCRNGSEKKHPRPLNSYILFRRNLENQIRTQNPGRKHTLKEISKIAGKSWKTQPDKVKRYFHVLAKLSSYRHKAVYPDYTYNPLRRFKNGDNFLFKHTDRERLAKRYNKNKSLSKKVKTSSMNDTDTSTNESFQKNEHVNEQPSTLLAPSSAVDFSHDESFSPYLPLYEFSDNFGVPALFTQTPIYLSVPFPYFTQSFPTFSPQCFFENDIDDINATEQIINPEYEI